MRTLAILAAILGAASAADDFKAAFKPLRLRKGAQLEKSIEPRLPKGIVIEAGPFDRLIADLLAPYGNQLERRVAVMPGLSGSRLKSAFKVLAKENADLDKRLAKVEASYAEFYNRGYMESSGKGRRARKMAAVLLPFYRTLRLRNRQVAAAAVPDASALAAPEPALRAAAVRAAAKRGELEAVQRAATGDGDPAVRGEALLALLRFKIREIREPVVAALGDSHWRVRALAIAIVVRARLIEAVGPLIGALEEETGRLRTDIDDALFALTGVRMYGDVALWKQWWASNRESMARKAKALDEAGEHDKVLGSLEGGAAGEEPDGAKRKERKERRGRTSAFYGITTQSKLIVFIIDISRSMQDPAQAKPAATTGKRKDPYPAPAGDSKLDIAQWQLHRAIQHLPKDALFDIVVYSESYRAWEEELVAATPRNKKKAHRFVEQLVGNGTTNIADSLDKAIELGPDTIFLLSDGVPNRGRVSDLDALLDELLARNTRARLVVHTVGIGEAAGSTFLKELARQTGGRYVGFR